MENNGVLAVLHSPRITSKTRDVVVLLFGFRARSYFLILGTPVRQFFRTLEIGALLKHSLLGVLRRISYESNRELLTIGCRSPS